MGPARIEAEMRAVPRRKFFASCHDGCYLGSERETEIEEPDYHAMAWAVTEAWEREITKHQEALHTMLSRADAAEARLATLEARERRLRLVLKQRAMQLAACLASSWKVLVRREVRESVEEELRAIQAALTETAETRERTQEIAREFLDSDPRP